MLFVPQNIDQAKEYLQKVRKKVWFDDNFDFRGVHTVAGIDASYVFNENKIIRVLIGKASSPAFPLIRMLAVKPYNIPGQRRRAVPAKHLVFGLNLVDVELAAADFQFFPYREFIIWLGDKRVGRGLVLHVYRHFHDNFIEVPCPQGLDILWLRLLDALCLAPVLSANLYASKRSQGWSGRCALLRTYRYATAALPVEKPNRFYSFS